MRSLKIQKHYLARWKYCSTPDRKKEKKKSKKENICLPFSEQCM
jgi:hypothetical protein